MKKHTFQWIERTVFEGEILAETQKIAESLFEFDGQPIKSFEEDPQAEIVKIEEV